MSEKQVLPEFGMPCRESQIAALQDKLAQSEAERERLQGELHHMTDNYSTLLDEVVRLGAELARERERHQELRQVVKEYREQCMNGMLTDCDTCQKADALLAPAPVATGEPRCTCKDTYEVGSGDRCPIHEESK